LENELCYYFVNTFDFDYFGNESCYLIGLNLPVSAHLFPSFPFIQIALDELFYPFVF